MGRCMKRRRRFVAGKVRELSLLPRRQELIRSVEYDSRDLMYYGSSAQRRSRSGLNVRALEACGHIKMNILVISTS